MGQLLSFSLQPNICIITISKSYLSISQMRYAPELSLLYIWKHWWSLCNRDVCSATVGVWWVYGTGWQDDGFRVLGSEPSTRPSSPSLRWSTWIGRWMGGQQSLDRQPVASGNSISFTVGSTCLREPTVDDALRYIGIGYYAYMWVCCF